jgi:hypothetical protein
MKSIDEQRFFDLAMKVFAKQSTDAERAELDSMLASSAGLRAEFEKLKMDGAMAKEALTLMKAVESSSAEFPGYARERLQTKVQQTLREPSGHEGSKWNWRWLLGLAAAAAVVVLLLPIARKPAAPLIQVAMLDTAGGVRGGENREIEVLKGQWKGATVQSFDEMKLAENWRTNWPASSGTRAKVIYDRAAGEVRVLVNRSGQLHEKTFALDQDLSSTLQKVDAFIHKQAQP